MTDETETAVLDRETDEAIAEQTTADTPVDEAVAMTEFECEHYSQIKALEAEAYEAEEEFDVANVEAKTAKKIWEGKVERLRQLIRGGPDPQRELPFGEDDSPPDSWKIVAIDTVLELSNKQLETLQEAGILTVEQFEDLRAGNGLTSLTGIGQATAEKWEEQMLDWMAVNAREDEPGEDFEAGTGDDIPSDPDSE